MKMTKRARAIPKAPAARLLNEAGAERVSDEAAEVFAEILEELALRIAEKSVRIAKHSGRKTVKKSDVVLAAAV
jgi:histone H3/H4